MSKHLSGLEIVDGQLIGSYTLSANEHVPVILDIDASNPELDDFSDLLSDAESSLNALSEETLDHLKTSISVELTDAAYPESQADMKTKAYADLQAELTLKEIVFYLDDVISMVFEAKKEYPEMVIYCQVDQRFAIEDLAVHPA